MKRMWMTLAVVLAATTLFAQDKLSVSICLDADNVLPIEKLLRCGKLTVDQEGWTIESFRLNAAANGVDCEFLTEGNKFSEEMRDVIKTGRFRKLYFERVKLVNEAGKREEVSLLVKTF